MGDSTISLLNWRRILAGLRLSRSVWITLWTSIPENLLFRDSVNYVILKSIYCSIKKGGIFHMSIQDRDWYWEDYKKKETDYDGDFSLQS